MDLLLASIQMKSMSIFEAGMLICFGASWPFALMKTIKTKDVKGKSKRFVALILIGYICGILHKILYNMDFVFWLYVANFLLVFADFALTILYGRNNFKKDDVKQKTTV